MTIERRRPVRVGRSRLIGGQNLARGSALAVPGAAARRRRSDERRDRPKPRERGGPSDRPRPAGPLYAYHPFITDRIGDTLSLEADHRHHAEIENAIRDLKYGMGLNHLPSGRFGANAAWLAVSVMAHNFARWTARLGLGAGIVTAKTLRRRFFGLAGRLTRSARRLSLHLPADWPWADEFLLALSRLGAIPLLA